MNTCISGILVGVLRLQEEIFQLQGKLDNSSALSEAHLGAHTRAENQVLTSDTKSQGKSCWIVILLSQQPLPVINGAMGPYKWPDTCVTRGYFIPISGVMGPNL